ncbi:hypothetical protein FJZ41_00445 [Candidatus Shapirobacteria bacterium]|nr:hypothetical protein [Candidatus Shapirobacteria bacterium]
MAKDRLKRILIVLFIVIFLLLGAKVFTDWQNKKKVAGESTGLPELNLGQKIGDLGDQVLGKAVEILPGGEALKEKVMNKQQSAVESQPLSETTDEGEKVEKVEIKTQEIIEIIKELPADQLENIKKQIFKDFCQNILKE